MQITCPVLSLARQYDDLARQYGETEDPAIWDRLTEIEEAVSHVSPQSRAGAAFQIMRVSTEVHLLKDAADEPHVRKAFEQRVERLLYRSLDALRSEAGEFPNAREHMMPEALDPRALRKIA